MQQLSRSWKGAWWIKVMSSTYWIQKMGFEHQLSHKQLVTQATEELSLCLSQLIWGWIWQSCLTGMSHVVMYVKGLHKRWNWEGSIMNIIYQWWIHLNCGIMSHFDFILYRIWSFGPKPHAFLPPRNKRLNKRSVSVCTQAYVCFLEEGMAAHSCILACRIPWTEEPRGLQLIGSQRVGHDWSNRARQGFRTVPLRQ